MVNGRSRARRSFKVTIIAAIAAAGLVSGCFHTPRKYEGTLMNDKFDDEVRPLLTRPEVVAIAGDAPKLSFGGQRATSSMKQHEYHGWMVWRKLGNSTRTSGSLSRDYVLTGGTGSGGLVVDWAKEERGPWKMLGWRALNETEFQQHLAEQAKPNVAAIQVSGT